MDGGNSAVADREDCLVTGGKGYDSVVYKLSQNPTVLTDLFPKSAAFASLGFVKRHEAIVDL